MVSQTSTLRSRATTCSLVMTSPSGSTMKPEPLPLSVVICTTPDWMRSISSASDDLLSSERSAAPTNWMLTTRASGGAGVAVGLAEKNNCESNVGQA